ncbi:helix-turn-helix domain-containing protein [Parahaliea mediterranea]|uniref:Helix-turn-helix transcriptional regulator n=1 Tax=Parahaliea mediterranea TaxID=651086 RepID=A0A939DDK2_9GAMM|nr:XRE family transcriptional regulator [Parahaliea mediterranea]MBN7796089.1 helix-turn-helix transcriptional regulator [Parahaliea mediterranea]
MPPEIPVDNAGGPAGDRVGDRLRELRKERKLTLEALSAKTGISVSSLSRIENTRLSLNVEKIQALAAALGVPPETFFSGESRDAPETVARGGEARLVIDRRRLRHPTSAGEVHQFHLFQELKDSRLETIYFEIDPVSIWDSEFVKHPGEKTLYVIEGDLIIYAQGRCPQLLETGDALFMDGSVWHSTVAANGLPARVFTVYLASGDPGTFETRFFTSEQWDALEE